MGTPQGSQLLASVLAQGAGPDYGYRNYTSGLGSYSPYIDISRGSVKIIVKTHTTSTFLSRRFTVSSSRFTVSSCRFTVSASRFIVFSNRLRVSCTWALFRVVVFWSSFIISHVRCNILPSLNAGRFSRRASSFAASWRCSAALAGWGCCACCA